MKKIITALAIVAVTLICQAASDMLKVNSKNPFEMRMYEQKFTVEYPSKEAAEAARLKIQPLLDGKKFAFSARWDDCRLLNVKMRDIMAKYACKGTFYLNSKTRKYAARFDANYAKEMTKKGCSVGAHSMSHPKLPNIPRSEAFYEILAIRPERESDTDKPINSFAFPWGMFKDKKDPTAQFDIAEYTIRSGLHHTTYPWFISKSKKIGLNNKIFSSVRPVNAQKGLKFEKADKKLQVYMKSRFTKAQPCLTLATHANHGAKDWIELEKILEKYSKNPEWWYCNQTDYAAYRYQFHYSKIINKHLSGNKVTYTIRRPHPADLGGDVPLTISTTSSKKVSGAILKKVNGKNFIELAHKSDKRVPEKIDYISNMKNSNSTEVFSKKFPGVKLFINYNQASNSIKLTAENKSDKKVSGIYSKLILPPAYAKRDEIVKIKTLEPKSKKSITVKLPARSSDKKYSDGKQYFALITDFNYGKTAGRIWSDTMQ
jgi:peptidoglycan/xylan/chitin deacetylase (PgdA/CDA1 family)